MIRNLLFAVALFSLALATSCAKGGSGPCVSNCPLINVSGASNGINPEDQAPISTASTPVLFTFTATAKNTTLSTVNWTLTGSSCSSSSTDSSNPCGFFTAASTSTTITYQSPTSVPSNPLFTVTATSGTDSSLFGTDDITIVDITTVVTPASPNVQFGLTQEFTAVAVPDNAPQSFSSWTCLATSVPCNTANPGSFTWTGNTAQYTPQSSQKCSSGNSCIQIYANAANDPTQCPGNSSCVSAQPALVASRVSGTYAFRFSGYDGSANPVSAAGTFTVATNGSISGVEVEATTSGAANTYSPSGGSYAPTCISACSSSTPVYSNNSGTLALNSAAVAYPYNFHVVLDGAGDIQMIESDGNGTGSGVAEPSAKNQFSTGTNQAFVFGFTGVDSGGHRVGYAGLLPMAPSTSCPSGSAVCGTITNGLMDVNDGGTGNVTSLCSSPCALTGSYYSDASIPGLWHLVLTTPVPATLNFDFFVANGSASGSTLTLYGVSTDAASTNPVVAGTMAIQKSLTYNNKAFSGTSVSALTGVDAGSSVVSLTLGTTDGTSGGTGGTGNFTGQFDQNDAGTILTYPQPNTSQTNFAYTYVADSSNNGRYTFQMLGNPGANPVKAPLPFILYASGANRGFLQECNTSSCNNTDTSVMTGTMIPQQVKNGFSFVPAGITGTYAVATSSNSLSNDGSCTVLGNCNATMNLLLTSPGNSVFDVTGTVNPSGQSANWNYTVQSQGVGNIVPPSGAKTPNFAFYGVSATEYYMIEEDKTVPSPVLHMEQ